MTLTSAAVTAVTESTRTAEIHAAERTRTDALTAPDLDALERLLTDDFVYVHASGRTEDRAAYLASVRSGLFRWTAFEHEDVTVRPLGDTALLYGLLHARKEEAGTTRDLLFRFVSVWVRQDDAWRLGFTQNLKPQQK